MNVAAGEAYVVQVTPKREFTRMKLLAKGLLGRFRRWFCGNDIKHEIAKYGMGYKRDYDLSPPKTTEPRPFEDAVQAIMEDWGDKIKIKVVEGSQGKMLKWISTKDGKDLPEFIIRVLLFLYGRRFYDREPLCKTKSKNKRISAIKRLMHKEASRRILSQIMALDGDKDRSSDEDCRMHYIRGCKTTLRYFLRRNAKGFLEDMTTLNYYLRIQNAGGSFLQAPAVLYSYIFSAHGQQKPPLDASRLVRHYFTDDELVKYVKDEGGASEHILGILAERMVDNKKYIHTTTCIGSKAKLLVQYLIEELKQGPVLVSRFTIKDQLFYCTPPSESEVLREQLPNLAEYDDWDEVPADKIPPGVARFSTWGKLGEFILLDCPSDKASEEANLEKEWKGRLEGGISTRSSGDVEEGIKVPLTEEERGTARHKSLSASRSESFRTLSTISTESGSMTTPRNTLCPSNPIFELDDQHEEFYNTPSAHTGGELNVRSTVESADDVEHAMVLVGYCVENGVYFWLLQNSWLGHMQLIEVSTEYLLQSHAHLHRMVIIDGVIPSEWRDGSHFHCSSPIAESSLVCRGDGGNWSNIKDRFSSNKE